MAKEQNKAHFDSLNSTELFFQLHGYIHEKHWLPMTAMQVCKNYIPERSDTSEYIKYWYTGSVSFL